MSPRALRSLVLAAAFATSATAASAASYTWDGTTASYTLTSSDEFTILAGATSSTGLAVTARDLNLNGDANIGGAFTFTQVGGGAYPQGIELIGASNTITATSISLSGDVGRQNADGGNLALNTSAANGNIDLNISLGRVNVWYIPTSFSANAGTGTITINGSGPASTGWRSTPVSLTGGAVNFSSTGSVSSNAAVTITNSLASSIASGAVLSGSMSLTKAGNGTLTISNGSNSFTGNIAINAGRVVVAAASGTAQGGSPTNSALGNMTTAGRTITVGNGAGSNAVLEFAFSDAIGAYNYVTPVTFIADGGTITRHSSTTFNSIGAITLRNGGKVVTTNGNAGTVGSFAFNGTVTVDGTSATASSIEPLSGQTSNNYINLGTNGGSTTFNITNTTAANALTVTSVLGDKVLGGAAALIKTGAGTMTLSATNTYSGGTTISNGTLAVGANAALGSGAVSLNAGALRLSGQTVSNNITLGGGSLYGAGTLSGVLSGSSGFTKSEAGTLALSGGANTFTGNVLISEGTLSITGASGTAISATPTNSGLGNMTTAGRTVTVDGSGSVLEFAVSDAMGAFGYASPVTLIAKNGGMILRSSSGGAFNSVGAVTLQEGGILKGNAGSNATVQSLSLNGNLTVLGTNAGGTIESGAGSNNGIHLRSVGSNGSLTFDVADTAATADLNVTANLLNPVQVNYLGFNASGTTAGILKTGAGRMDLSGSNSFSGGLTVRSGTAVAGSASGLGSGTVTLNDASTGSSSASVLINATGGSVTVGNNITVANQGSGTATLGSATTSGSGLAVFSGTVTLNRDTTFSGGAAGDQLGFSGNIAGSGNVTIGGSNRVVYTGTAKSYTGTTTIGLGSTLQLSDGTSTSNSFLADGATLVVNGALKLAKGNNSETVAGLSGSGTVSSVSGTNTLIVGSGDATGATFGGSLVNEGATLALTKVGTGTQTLSGASTYTGATSVNNGTLALGAGGSLGATALTIASGATFTTASGTTVGGSVTADSGSTLTANGTISGAVSVAGTATLSGSLTSTLGVTGAATVGSTGSVSGATTLSAGGSLTANGSLGTVGVASGATLRGSGSVGATTVANGTASLVAGNGSSGSLTLSSLTFDGTGTLSIGSLANYTSAAAFVVTNALTLNGGAVTLSLPAGVISNGTYKLISYGSSTASIGNFTVSGPVIGARQSGGLEKDTVNKVFQLVIGGDSPKWTGANGTAFSGGSNWKLINGNTATDFLANDSLLLDDSASSYTVDISGGNVAPAAIAFENATANYVLQGDSGLSSGTIAKSGAGDLRINNANSATSVAISGGSVTLGASGALGTSAVTLSGGTLDLNGQTTAAAIALSGGSIAGNGTVSGVVSGSGSISKSVAGTLTLSAQNTFTGGTTVSNGVLALGHDTNTLVDAGAVTVSGGELSLGSNNDTVGAVTVSGGSVTGSGTLTGSSYTVTGGTVSAKLGGAGALTKSGAGTATLSGANTYSGGTTLSNGTLAVGDDLALGSASVALDGGTLQLSGQTLGNAIALGGGSVSGNGTLSGVVSGSSGLTKSGAGALTLSGANTFTGAITVSGGSLSVSGTLGSGGSYSGAIALNGSDALTLTSSSNQTLSGVISGSRGLVKSGSGNLTLSGDSTFTGDITLSGGTTFVSRTNNVSNPVSSALGNLTTANRRITVGAGATLNFVNADVLGQYDIKTGVTLVADGGTITRSYSASNYFNSLGDVILKNGGRLVAANGGNNDVRSFSLNGTITVEGSTGGSIESTASSFAGIHLGTVGGNTTFNVGDTGSTDDLLVSAPLVNQVFLSAASLTKSGAGRMALSGSNSYTGNTILSAGTLALTSGGGIYRGGYIASNLSIASGATLEVQGWGYNESTASLGGLSANASSITVNGGTIRVTGASPTSYGRGVTVNSGGVTLEAATGATWTIDTVNDSQAWVYNGNPSVTLGGAGTGTFQKVLGLGTGSVTKSGAGTWTLSAANTYTGGTTIQAGKLIIGNLAALGTGSVTVSGGVLDLAGLAPTNVIVLSGGSLLNESAWAAAGSLQVSGNVDSTFLNSLPTAEIKVAAGATVNLTGVTKDIVFEGGSLSNLSGFSGKLKVKGSLDLSSVDPQGQIEVAAGGTVDFGSRASSKTVKFTGGSVTGSNFTGDVEVVGSGVTLGSGIQAGRVRLTSGNSATIQSGFGRDIAFAGGTLSGLANYSGTVSLETGATLSVGDTTTADFSLASGSVLKGSGSVGTITQAAGSTLAPGNSPGLLTAGTFELAGGASMQVEFIAGSGVRGQAYDAVTVTGELDLSGLGTGNRYTLNLVSLSALPSTGGPLDGFDDSSAYIYELFTYATLTLPESYTGNIADLFTISTAAFVPGIDNPWASGAWTIFNNEGTKTLELQYAPIPEPSTYGLILGGLALAAAAARRRRKS